MSAVDMIIILLHAMVGALYYARIVPEYVTCDFRRSRILNPKIPSFLKGYLNPPNIRFDTMQTTCHVDVRRVDRAYEHLSPMVGLMIYHWRGMLAPYTV